MDKICIYAHDISVNIYEIYGERRLPLLETLKLVVNEILIIPFTVVNPDTKFAMRLYICLKIQLQSILR